MFDESTLTWVFIALYVFVSLYATALAAVAALAIGYLLGRETQEQNQTASPEVLGRGRALCEYLARFEEEVRAEGLFNVLLGWNRRTVGERNELRMRLAFREFESYRAKQVTLVAFEETVAEALAWPRLEAAAHSGAPLEGRVVDVVEEGLVVDLGVKGFLPSSLVEISYRADLEDFLGQTIECKVVEVNYFDSRVLLSRRGILLGELTQAREQAAAWLHRGALVDGYVTEIDESGVWVELQPGVVGLIPVSFLGRPQSLLELEQGQGVTVKVMEFKAQPFLLSLTFG